MAKMFLDPQILECDIENTENNVIFGSGMVPEDWTAEVSYRNHNSGSHSEVEFHFHYNGSGCGDDHIIANCVMIHGLKLDYIKDSGGKNITNVTENGFTLDGFFHHNPNEDVKFNIQIVVKNGPLRESTGHRGAARQAGDFNGCDVAILGCSHR